MAAKELVECIFCHGSIQIDGKQNLKNYTGHLDKEHRILFDLEHVLKRTLELKPPQDMTNIKSERKQSNAPKDTSEVSSDNSGLRRSSRNKAKSSVPVRSDTPPDPDEGDKDKDNNESVKEEATMKESLSATIQLQRIQEIKAALGNLQFDKDSVEVKEELFHEQEDDPMPTVKPTIKQVTPTIKQVTPTIKQEPLEIEHFNDKKRSHESAFPESTPINAKKFARMLSEASQDSSFLQFSKNQITAESTPKPPVTIRKPVIAKAMVAIKETDLEDVLEPSQIKKEFRSDSFNQNEDLNYDQKEENGDNQEEQFSDDDDEQINNEEQQIIEEEQIIDNNTEHVNDKNDEEPNTDNISPTSSTGSIPWYHGFLYSCQLCTRQFVDKSGLKIHVEANHDMNYDEYQPKYEEQSVTKNLHECENCGKGVFWYKSAIESHVTGQHNMSLEKYYEIYKDEIEPPNLTITDDTLLTRFVPGASSNTASDMKASNSGNNSFWANKCIYECKLCGKIMNSASVFQKHIPYVHSIPLSEYTKQYGRTVKHEEKHHCQIEKCKSQIIWDKVYIFTHLRDRHDRMTLQQYEEQYMGNYTPKSDVVEVNQESDIQWANRCTFKCELCQSETDARSKFKKHFKAKHTMTYVDYLQKYGNSISEEVRHSCQIESCGANILWDKTSMYGHLVKIHEISLNEYHSKYMGTYVEKTDTGITSQRKEPNTDVEWANQCTFKCALCDIATNSRAKFKIHFKTNHNISYVDYLKEHGKSIIYEKRHSCQIESCDAFILWDRSSLYDHLLTKHNMTVGDYKKDYMDNYAEKLEKNIPKTTVKSGINWANRCKYKCAICQNESDSRSSFGHHLKYYHKSSITDYSKIYGKSILHEEKHSCQVESCESLLYWDRSSISGHLKLIHDGMPIEDYRVKYMDTYVEKESEKESKTMTLEEYRASGVSKSGDKPHVDAVDKYDTDWSNKCIFKCAICEVECNSRSKFQTHMNSRHKISLTEYSKIHGRSILHEEKHSCQVEACETFMSWDRSSIQNHLKIMHDSMMIEDYRVKYMDNYVEKESANGGIKSGERVHQDVDRYDTDWSNKCIFKCEICKVEFNSRSKFSHHMNARHQINLTEYARIHGKSILHEEKHSCQVESCKAAMIWDRSSIASHLKLVHDSMMIEDYRNKYMDNYVEKETTKVKSPVNVQPISWANRCICKCALCGMTTKSQSKFTGHIKSKHNLIKLDYATNYGRTMEYEEKHTCQIKECGSSFWWTAGSFKSHFKLKHSDDDMTLDKYEKQYMTNYLENNKTVSSLQPMSWANRCVYKCALCEMTTKSQPKFDGHIKSRHKLTKLDYATKYGRTTDYEEKHTCQISGCGSVFWWSAGSFKCHFKLKHSDEEMTLNKYEEQYMANYTERNKTVSKPGTSASQSTIHDKLSECTFTCNMCPGKLLSSKKKTVNHMRTEHKTNMTDYKEKYGSCLTTKIDHCCQICGSIVLWDSNTLRNHMYSTHENMPLEEYFSKFIEGFAYENEWLDKITFECKQCIGDTKFSTKNRTELWKHVESNHKQTEIEYRGIHGSLYGPNPPLSHTCQICFSSLNWESISLKPHIELKHKMTAEEYVERFKNSYSDKQPEGELRNNLKPVKSHNPAPVQENLTEADIVALKWTRGSLYKCNVCQKGVAGLDQFKKHLEDRHDVDYREYERSYDAKDYILFAGFHICKICNKNVKHDRPYLENHVKEHKMNITQYFTKHQPKPPKLARMMKNKEEGAKKKLLPANLKTELV